MALITCKECNTEISDKAETCPKCGAKRPKKISGISFALVLFMGVFLYRCTSLGVERDRAAMYAPAPAQETLIPARSPKVSEETKKEAMRELEANIARAGQQQK